MFHARYILRHYGIRPPSSNVIIFETSSVLYRTSLKNVQYQVIYGVFCNVRGDFRNVGAFRDEGGYFTVCVFDVMLRLVRLGSCYSPG
jgi:hypothetical protein